MFVDIFRASGFGGFAAFCGADDSEFEEDANHAAALQPAAVFISGPATTYGGVAASLREKHGVMACNLCVSLCDNIPLALMRYDH